MSGKEGKRRVRLPRNCDYTRQFKRDWENLRASGRYDLGKLKQVMMLLIAGDTPLGPEWRDHALTGNWRDHRECHVGGDFLLIYRVLEDGKTETVVFVRAGTHSELF